MAEPPETKCGSRLPLLYCEKTQTLELHAREGQQRQERSGDAIMDAAQRQGIAPKQAHDILTAQEAIHLVSQHVGVAIVTKPASGGPSAEGVVIRPLADPSLSFETCLIMRADEDSRLANDFGRSFLRTCAPPRLPPTQLTLPLLA
jgi:hypothetical protein